MRPLQDISIGSKLTLLLAGAVGAALLLAFVVLVSDHVITAKASMREHLSALTDVLAENSAAALTFEDADAATSVLSSLHLEPTIVFARTFNATGKEFATYRTAGSSDEQWALPFDQGHQFTDDGHLEIVTQVIQENELLGTVYVRASLEVLQAQTQRHIAMLALVLFASLAGSVLIGSRLQRVVSAPILRLAEAAESVTTKADYSIRVEKRTHDEIGTLCDGFNAMLAQIENRDAEQKRLEESLRRARDELELRVEQRTSELQESNEDLKRSNQELDDFAYVASHDLKEPLRGIHNYASFLIEDYSDRLDEEGAFKLKTLQRLSQRMETLIDSLLTYSRVGRVDLAVEDTDLNQVVAEVLDSLFVRLEEEQVDVRIPMPLPTVRCDRVRIAVVFRNLITNSMKYNDKPQKWIEIGHRPQERQNGHPRSGVDASVPSPATVFYVRDNGIGIQEKHRDSIFRIFKRLHGRDKFGGGTGAGLTIVKKIVERHGGSISVDSTYCEGTTFQFTLSPSQPAPS